MSVKHLERLQLDADRVIAAFSFLSSYAQSCLKERGNTEVGDEPSSASPSTDARYQRQWNLTVEAASTLFEAGQWAMLIDPERALDLWSLAGVLYRELDFGFGYYLSVIASRPGYEGNDHQTNDPLGHDLTSAMRKLVSASHLADKELGRRDVPALPEPMLHPQQQAYLLLAASTAAAAVSPDSEMAYMTSLLIERSPHRFGVAPVGGLSIPIRTVWRVAGALLRRTSDGARLVADVLVQLAGAYQESIDQAMTNAYLWSNAASPVDVGSFDIAAITSSTLRVYRSDGRGVIDERLEMLGGERFAVARSQMEIAVEVGTAALIRREPPQSEPPLLEGG